jgi:8-oxo-dGTP pyrophosphatase MutT (NUDIX family)
LLQHRDNIPGIWYPDHWGCFGGAVDDGEEPFQALIRELEEEIELKVHEAAYFTRFEFDLTEIGRRHYYRMYYVVTMTGADLVHIRLHEGKAVRAFSGEEILKELRVTPYDAFALFLHYARHGLSDVQDMTRAPSHSPNI